MMIGVEWWSFVCVCVSLAWVLLLTHVDPFTLTLNLWKYHSVEKSRTQYISAYVLVHPMPNTWVKENETNGCLFVAVLYYEVCCEHACELISSTHVHHKKKIEGKFRTCFWIIFLQLIWWMRQVLNSHAERQCRRHHVENFQTFSRAQRYRAFAISGTRIEKTFNFAIKLTLQYLKCKHKMPSFITITLYSVFQRAMCWVAGRLNGMSSMP